MPFVQRKDSVLGQRKFASSGLARYKAGEKNVVKLHTHRGDEYVFMIEGKCIMRSEDTLHTLEAGDVFLTQFGDKHEILEIIEDTVFFWLETDKSAF